MGASTCPRFGRRWLVQRCHERPKATLVVACGVLPVPVGRVDGLRWIGPFGGVVQDRPPATERGPSSCGTIAVLGRSGCLLPIRSGSTFGGRGRFAPRGRLRRQVDAGC